jgi:hypothetical protein
MSSVRLTMPYTRYASPDVPVPTQSVVVVGCRWSNVVWNVSWLNGQPQACMQFESRWSQFSSQFGRGLRSQTALHWIDALLHWIVHALPSAAVLDEVVG